MEQPFKLDRHAFSAMTMEEADHQMTDYRGKTSAERLAISQYLNSICYRFSIDHPPKMEKVFTGARKLGDEISF